MSSFQIINDSYYFECTKCGNCCTGDIRITLNLYDLFKMARYLSFKNTSELFEKKYIQLYKHEHNVWLPEIRFKTKPVKFCPFLINDTDDKNYLQGLCSLHPDMKPLICALAPVGRILDFEEDSDQFVFIKPAPDCPGVDEKKENHLAAEIAVHEYELNHQMRFFKILQQLKEIDYPAEYYLENLYYFYVDLSFKDIMTEVENKMIPNS